MKHTTTGGTGNWTRNFVISSTTNQLMESSIGSDGTGSESYDYDNRGNMVDGMNHLLSMTYNEENRLEQVEINSSQTACYQYDHDGQRVRKVITNTSAAIRQVRKYVGNWEVYQKIDTGTNTVILERETLHVEDDQKRIALIDTPTVDTLSTGESQLLRYQHSNNINTASLELDENAAVITYEEYYPYGNTSFQGGRTVAECSLKRYRYTGKERDEETGLNYHGARYYAPWLARWMACDPINDELYNYSSKSRQGNINRHYAKFTASVFEYCYANPVRFIDTKGEQPYAPPQLEYDWFTNTILRIFVLPVVYIYASLKASAAKEKASKPPRETEITDSVRRWGDRLTGATFAVSVGIDLFTNEALNAKYGASAIQNSSNKFLSKLGAVGEGAGVVLVAAGITISTLAVASEIGETGELKVSSATDWLIGTGIAIGGIATGEVGFLVAGAVYGLIRILGGKQIDEEIDSIATPFHLFNKN
ncbi:MAG: RHS repeat-associated core domain-containing protein [Taibaiella sp.]|nr:RHS repeat-associated core domain-containing protein [Taibaiella sp.]